MSAILMNHILPALPLSDLANVIRSRDASTINPVLAFCSLLNGSLWTGYGFAISDPFVWGPNIVGVVLTLVQLGLIVVFRGNKPVATPTPAAGFVSEVPITKVVAVDIYGDNGPVPDQHLSTRYIHCISWFGVRQYKKNTTECQQTNTNQSADPSPPTSARASGLVGPTNSSTGTDTADTQVSPRQSSTAFVCMMETLTHMWRLCIAPNSMSLDNYWTPLASSGSQLRFKSRAHRHEIL
ncbi:hypothetical protein BASA60_003329 [Batrachochytrium salamandrivorans]|nr:hypothetical protein BASA60_003329 [Batrachochytrium salamandrivorans]